MIYTKYTNTKHKKSATATDLRFRYPLTGADVDDTLSTMGDKMVPLVLVYSWSTFSRILHFVKGI